jgi:hypothetical protein
MSDQLSAVYGMDRVRITPDISVELQGYGDRTGFSEGIHDDLYAVALYSNDGESAWLWIALDVCLLSVEMRDHLATLVSAAVEIPQERIVFSAVHTHAGPDLRTFSDEKRPWALEYIETLGALLAQVAVGAKAKAEPAEAIAYQSAAFIGVNRRRGTQEYAGDLGIVRFRTPDKRHLGTLFTYPCHLTVLGSDNRLISADWLHYTREAYAQRYHEPLMFVQGPEGNVDPKTRGILDMNDGDQSKGASFQEASELGTILAKALFEAIERSPGEAEGPLRLTIQRFSFPLRYGPLDERGIEKEIQRHKQFFAQALSLREDEIPEGTELNGLVKKRAVELKLPAQSVGHLVAKQFSFISFLLMYRWNFGGKRARLSEGMVEVDSVVLRGKRLLAFGLPMEVLNEANAVVRNNFPGRSVWILSIVNGWYGYLPVPENFAEASSDLRYETVSTIFAESAFSQYSAEMSARLLGASDL